MNCLKRVKQSIIKSHKVLHYLKNYINQILPTAENEKSQCTKFNMEVGDVILRRIDVSVLCHHTLFPNSETIWCPYLFSCLATILIVFSLMSFFFYMMTISTHLEMNAYIEFNYCVSNWFV